MNYTEKYHLPQWKKEDRIMMEDFNQMCADMEAGLEANAQAAAELPYVVGSYVGQDQEVTIELGFKPSFVICSGMPYCAAESVKYIGAFTLISAGNVLKQLITFTDTGFIVRQSNADAYPKMVEAPRIYDYIAFR